MNALRLQLTELATITVLAWQRATSSPRHRCAPAAPRYRRGGAPS